MRPFPLVNVYSALPDELAAAADVVLRAAGVEHRRLDSVAAAVQDPRAVALLGPFRSAEVSAAVRFTAPARLPLLAPVATWAGVTRVDEPGCEEAVSHFGTVLRLVARDTEVAGRVADDIARSGARAFVIAGDHDYGRQLDRQLDLAGLERVVDESAADLIVLCGLAGQPEIRAAARSSLPIVAFDGVHGASLGTHHEVRLALPFGPGSSFRGVDEARRAAELVVAGLAAAGGERDELLEAMRRIGGFDPHGDPIGAPVWLWRAGVDWTLSPERALASSGG